MSIVTRFPPSPTGFMHIGSARTALFNWLYARRHGGKMLFRVEDTDRARHSEEAVIALINAMKWLELDWDGEIVSQFEQRERHEAIARELLAQGKAYQCYCTQEELARMREEAKAEGRAVFYDRRWRDKSAAEAPADTPFVIRIKAPLSGQSTLHDLVQGDVTVAHEQLDDFILLRADGTPTYMLSVVVDDHDMGVTHVIRGDDHLNNTFRQNIIYEAMGWDKPHYAHVPLILGPDGTKMSKRHGAASVEEYRDMGYLPEAMRNYLLRLGWSHGDEEIISTQEALKWFDLEHIGRSPARFDFAKLESLNAHYMQTADNNRLLDLIRPLFEDLYGIILDNTAERRLLEGMDELKSRSKTLVNLVRDAAFYAKTLPLDYDEKARQIIESSGEILGPLLETFENLEEFSPESVQDACKKIAETLAEGKLGKVGMPLRAALTGTTSSPSIFHAAAILGKEECLARLKGA